MRVRLRNDLEQQGRSGRVGCIPARCGKLAIETGEPVVDRLRTRGGPGELKRPTSQVAREIKVLVAMFVVYRQSLTRLLNQAGLTFTQVENTSPGAGGFIVVTRAARENCARPQRLGGSAGV
jgi:hypothetical protein